MINTQTFRIISLLTTGFIFTCPLVGQPSESDQKLRPNILFLYADDMRSDSLGALGDRIVRTPNLDALVRRGMAFRNVYNLGANNQAVCIPARNMLLTGNSYFRYKDYLGPGMPENMRGLFAPADSANMPNVFNNAGYETWHYGKRGASIPPIQDRFRHVHYLENDMIDRIDGEPGRPIVDGAIEFLEKRSGEAPFFMYLAFCVPHDPRIAAEKYRRLYDPQDIPLPDNYLPLHPFDNGDLIVRDEAISSWPRSKDEIKRTWREYYAVITGLDAQIGRLLDTLRASGELERTIIVFTADQGIAIGSHGLLGKQNLYEASVKIPFVIAGPGIASGMRDAFVYSLDIFPTLCELAEIPVPEGIDGKSFKAVIEGKLSTTRTELFLSYTPGNRNLQKAIREGQWKLIKYPQINYTQLFNLANDPNEIVNLAAEPDQARRVSDMIKRLAALQAEFGDDHPLVVQNPQPASWTPPTGEELWDIRIRAEKMWDSFGIWDIMHQF